ncbi:MAG: hypothetical protein BWY42_01132 [Candidatus Omnitrophica bacterium ADurb.Bin277]|nr:MAG: hypothetical protein BWY42_01132 [Candidatus Omnitrophica bacterium ADurb.Bin277]
MELLLKLEEILECLILLTGNMRKKPAKDVNKSDQDRNRNDNRSRNQQEVFHSRIILETMRRL